MRTQRYLLFLPGLMVDAGGGSPTTGVWPRQTEQQVATRLDLVAQGVQPTVLPAKFQLTLDAVAQGVDYLLPIATIVGENLVLPPNGLTIPANTLLGVICTQSSYAADIACWITQTDSAPITSTDPWVALTLADLQAQISNQELSEFTTAILQQGQPDSVTSLIDQMTKFVRGFVSRGGNVMGLEGTVPCELMDATLNLVKDRLFERVAVLKKFSEDARLVAKDAREFLSEEVATGKFNVSMPVELAVNQMQVNADVEIVSPSLRRRFTRHRLDGFQ